MSEQLLKAEADCTKNHERTREEVQHEHKCFTLQKT